MESDNKNEKELILWKILKDKKLPFSGEELSEISGIKISSVRATLGKMVKDKRLKKAGGGKFIIPSKNKR